MNIIIEQSKTIPVRYQHFNALTWLIKAAAGDVMRHNISQIIHVNQGICYCTDGQRLHVYSQDSEELPTNDYLQDGNYRIKSATKKLIILETVDPDEFEYPAVDRILAYQPKVTKHYRTMAHFTNFVFTIFHDWDTMINIDYLRDAFMEEDIKIECTVSKIGPIVFGIMPIIRH